MTRRDTPDDSLVHALLYGNGGIGKCTCETCSARRQAAEEILRLRALVASRTPSETREPDGYAVLLDDPKGDTPGNCGFWYVGAYRTEVVAKNVAERGKQGARVVPMFFAPPSAEPRNAAPQGNLVSRAGDGNSRGTGGDKPAVKPTDDLTHPVSHRPDGAAPLDDKGETPRTDKFMATLISDNRARDIGNFARQLERELAVAQGLEQMAMEQRNKAFDDLQAAQSATRPIPTSQWRPTCDALLLTTSKVWIIGDWYQGAWRTHLSQWKKIDGKQVLVSAFREEEITHWMHLPEIQLYVGERP